MYEVLYPNLLYIARKKIDKLIFLKLSKICLYVTVIYNEFMSLHISVTLLEILVQFFLDFFDKTY